MKKLMTVIGLVLVMCLLVSFSCANATTPAPAPRPPEPPVPGGGRQLPVSGETPSLAWMEKVTNAWVVAHRHDWDADAEDDGIRIWVELLDSNEEMIEYKDVTLPVKIEIYSTESRTFPWKPSRLIYSATASLRNWRDDAFVTGAIGVRDIAWEEISPPLPSEQQEYGLIYVTVTLPNDKDYSARYDEVRIKE